MQNYAYKPKPVWGYTELNMEQAIDSCAFSELPVQVLIGRSVVDNSFIIKSIIPLVDPTDYLKAPEKWNGKVDWSLELVFGQDWVERRGN